MNTTSRLNYSQNKILSHHVPKESQKITLEFGLSLQRSNWIKLYYSSPWAHKSLSATRQYQGLHKPLPSFCSASADSSFSTYSPMGAPFVHVFYISFISEQSNTGLQKEYIYFYLGSFCVNLEWSNEHAVYKQTGWGTWGYYYTDYTDATQCRLLQTQLLNSL